MKNILKLTLAALLLFGFSACRDHEPSEEDFPSQAINFTYIVNEATYTLDFYVGATIKFYPTVPVSTDVEWDFGDGSAKVTGDTVYHKFTVAGSYNVTATGNGGKKTNVIYISDIKPIVSLISEDSICEVTKSYISFNIELPNPDNLDVEYRWSFPDGTTNEAGDAVSSFVGTAEQLGKVKFAKVGSQAVKIQTVLGGRNLELVTFNVQVALNEEAPTVYYAVKDGNIMALKIPDHEIEGVTIEPYNMGVSTGQHMFNLVMDESTQQIYMLDCGKVFTYVNDVDGNMGDGKMQVMTTDASAIETVISNVGGPSFQDPYYGCIVGTSLFYSDRNTGFFQIDKTTRNAVWNEDDFPYYVVNNKLNYYGVSGLVYGAFNANFNKIGEVWYWAKTDNGRGIWRFKDSDILAETVPNGAGDASNLPADGHILGDFCTRSFVYDADRDQFFVSAYGDFAGLMKCKLSELDGLNSSNYKDYCQKTAAGGEIKPITNSGSGEGNVSEYIGVCELALDKATGDVYFGYRSSDTATMPSGLYRYNNKTGKLELMVANVDIYGVCLNNTAKKLF